MIQRFSRRLAALVVSAVTMTACSPTSAELVYERTTVDGQSVLGAHRTQTQIHGVVVFFHGLDRDENILELDQPHQDLVHALTDAGYAVVASHAGGNAFGNTPSQQNYAALIHDSTERYGTSAIYFVSESMGTVAAVNLMAKDDGIPAVRGLAAINPLLNLEDIPPNYLTAVEASYGAEVPATESPLQIPLANLSGRNMRLYVTPSDSVVPSDANAYAFQQRFRGVANVSIATCRGNHMDPSCIQGTDIVEWFHTLHDP